MTGEQLVAALRGLELGLPVILMSGMARLGGATWGLAKPFSRDELSGVLVSATER